MLLFTGIVNAIAVALSAYFVFNNLIKCVALDGTLKSEFASVDFQPTISQLPNADSGDGNENFDPEYEDSERGHFYHDR